MVPVGTIQVGGVVSDATGAGSVGNALMETDAGRDIQPVVLFLTVILCEPGAKPLIEVPV